MSSYKQTLPSEILSTFIVGFSYKPLCMRLKTEVIKDGYEKIKPPYLLLINHPSEEDYKIASAVMAPQRLSFVVSNESFAQKAFLMRMMGAIPKRMYAVDTVAVRRMVQVAEKGGVVAIFPEGKASADGRPSPISKNIVKLIRLMRVPVVAMNISGTYIDKPLSAKSSRGGRVKVRLKNLFSVNDIDYLDDDSIYSSVVEAMKYDEYEYQKTNRIAIKGGAASLTDVLYQCPQCQKEFTLTATKTKIKCKNCGAEWTMGRYGVLLSDKDKISTSVSSWYDFQRKYTSTQLDKGDYELKGACSLHIMRKVSDGYKNAGNGFFEHNGEIFVYTGSMEGKNVRLSFANQDRVALNCKYGESVEFSTFGISYKFVFANGAEVAKVNLVIEESYKI